MSNAHPETSIRKAYGIPKCIISSPADNGNDDNSLSDWAYVIQHEIDLYEEDQDSPDIKTKRQYHAAISALMKLKAATVETAPKSEIQIAQEYLDGQIELAEQAHANCEKHKTVFWTRQYRQQLKDVEKAKQQLAALSISVPVKTERINTGLYRFTVNGRKFEAEDIARCKRENGDSTDTRPDWNLFEIINGSREWWNDFVTLSDCKAAALRTTAQTALSTQNA